MAAFRCYNGLKISRRNIIEEAVKKDDFHLVHWTMMELAVCVMAEISPEYAANSEVPLEGAVSDSTQNAPPFVLRPCAENTDMT